MRKFWQWLATALLVAIFLSLANWQWNRASELRNPPKIDETIVPLDSLVSPTDSIAKSLSKDKVGRIVSISGRYVSSWIAPYQRNNKIWDVGLLQTKDNALILVVRGFHKDIEFSDHPIVVKGYLLPPQSEDVAKNQGNQLSRVDSALFASKTNLPLYAPYINAITEDPQSGYESVPLNMVIAQSNLPGGVPGFYWQHLSYVVIWVLFAITAVYLMLYQRRIERLGKV